MQPCAKATRISDVQVPELIPKINNNDEIHWAVSLSMNEIASRRRYVHPSESEEHCRYAVPTV